MKGAGRFHATRQHPESAGLAASLRHVSGWPVLSITGSPQTLELLLVNRMPHPVSSGHTLLRLLFRPGILTDLEQIALAPQSEAQWALQIPPADGRGNQSLQFAVVEAFTLAPGEARAIRIDGISAAALGGSRATRVQFHYQGLALADGAEVEGSRLLHLPVLRRHEPVGLPATELRTGSTAESGPFIAGLLDGPDLLNDGRSENTLKLRIVNGSGLPIPLSDDSDQATRFYLSFKTGATDADWGLLGNANDHLAVSLSEIGNLQASWQIDNHTLRCIAPTVWGSRDWLDLTLTVFTTARIGEAQLVLTFENLPGHDDGDLVLLVHPGPMLARAENVVVGKPLEVRGKLSVDGDLSVSGVVRSDANHLQVTPHSFKLGGESGRFYPVVFRDLAWTDGEFRLEVFRAHTDTDSPRHGSMMARLVCHSDNDGQGSGYWALVVDQNKHLVGGFESYRYAAQHVLWLAGGTTYQWIANHRSEISNLTSLGEPASIELGSASTARKYSPKVAADAIYLADHVALSERQIGNASRDTSPVPRGAVIMWSGSAEEIPLGWALCDNQDGRPDLADRFVLGAGREISGAKGDADLHSHAVAAPTATTTSDGAHTHKFPSDWYKRDLDDGNYSGIDTDGGNVADETVQSAGGHNHTVKLPVFTTREAAASRPRWYALCFIIKL